MNQIIFALKKIFHLQSAVFSKEITSSIITLVDKQNKFCKILYDTQNFLNDFRGVFPQVRKTTSPKINSNCHESGNNNK